MDHVTRREGLAPFNPLESSVDELTRSTLLKLTMNDLMANYQTLRRRISRLAE